ncbi:MAG: GWxTD domain-containing protein [Candidatus Palauibacterales bacterium]|nr:GWxTD domain-containing protein [Candidatus Palauibacterales bacterium]
MTKRRRHARDARPWRAFGLVALLALGSTGTLVAQTPELYERAQADLASSDTAAALASLRQLTEDEPNYAPGWGLLGRVLTEIASGVGTDFKERREAEEALRRAIKLDSGSPIYFASLGKLMRKQQIYLDARRMLNRAISKLEEDPSRLTPEETAELWFQRGLFLEDEYLDGWHFHTMQPLPPVVTPECSQFGSFCMNFARPKNFNEYFLRAQDLSEDADDEFRAMVEAFEKALEADSAHAGAFRRLAIHYVDRGDYGQATGLARKFIGWAPEEPWGYLILGLVYQRTGRDSLAELQFDRGIANASDEIASHYRDVSNLLRVALADAYDRAPENQRKQLEDVLWRRSDPLYLTSENEVRVGHLARVAYADIMFEDPAEGTWGADTEQGVIYARYGEPARIWKIRRDPRLEASSLTSVGASGGGRWIFWNYGWEIPNFIFQKVSRWRHISHVTTSYSKGAEDEIRASVPAVFTTSFELVDLPAQMARFKGPVEGGGVVEVDFYAAIPAASILLPLAATADSLDSGFFIFAGPAYNTVVSQRLRLALKQQPQPISFSTALPPGRYEYRLEARASTEKAAARRGELELIAFPEDSLALSDIVLARSVAPKTRDPGQRRDFAIRVNQNSEFENDDPFALYWEVYGLESDRDGIGQYELVISVSDAEGKGVFASVIGALGSLVGAGDDKDGELVFERTVEVRGDRVPDYLELTLSDEPGLYRVRIRLTDRLSGETAEAERTFRLVSP